MGLGVASATQGPLCFTLMKVPSWSGRWGAEMVQPQLWGPPAVRSKRWRKGVAWTTCPDFILADCITQPSGIPLGRDISPSVKWPPLYHKKSHQFL